MVLCGGCCSSLLLSVLVWDSGIHSITVELQQSNLLLLQSLGLFGVCGSSLTLCNGLLLALLVRRLVPWSPLHIVHNWIYRVKVAAL